MLARTACWLQGRRIVPQFGRQQGLHGGPDALHDRAQVARLVLGRPLELFDRGLHRAALRVPEHDHQPRAEARRRELDAADLRGGDNVAGDADDEQIAEALVEDNLRRHARVRASEDDRERLLRRWQLVAARPAGQRAITHAVTEAEIPLSEPFECLTR